jgi:hypothetical protein
VVGPPVIVMENDATSLPAPLLASTEKLYVPAVVGVPEIVPLLSRFKPAGNAPLSKLHVIGVSPLALSDWLYDVPTVPPGNVEVVILGAAPLSTTQPSQPADTTANTADNINIRPKTFIRHTPFK